MIFLLFLKSVIWTPQLRRLQPLLAIIRLGRRQLVTSLVSKDIFQQEHPITFLTSDLKRVKQIRSHIREFDPNYYLQIRMMPAVHTRTKLPDGFTESQAIQYASETTKKITLSALLDTPHGVIHWFSNTGVLYASRVMKAPFAVFHTSRF